MATRKINSFIEHLMNESMTASAAGGSTKAGKGGKTSTMGGSYRSDDGDPPLQRPFILPRPGGGYGKYHDLPGPGGVFTIPGVPRPPIDPNDPLPRLDRRRQDDELLKQNMPAGPDGVFPDSISRNRPPVVPGVPPSYFDVRKDKEDPPWVKERLDALKKYYGIK